MRIARLRGEGPPGASAAVPGVAVLPFRTVGADPALWHEGIVDMLSYNLDGIGQLRKIDPVTVLTGWRRMGGSASNALSADDAREVGRRLARMGFACWVRSNHSYWIQLDAPIAVVDAVRKLIC